MNLIPAWNGVFFMIIVNTGNGKGKTTAAIGQIIRALGRGWKVCLIQLFKGEEFYGEQKVLCHLKNLDFYSFAPKHPKCFSEISTDSVKEECRVATAAANALLKGRKKYDLFVLEEFNIAVRDGYINVKELLELVKNINQKSDVIVTGRGAPEELLEQADLVTEMKEIKHPYAKGIPARKGIEY